MSNSTSTRVPHGQTDLDHPPPKIETAGEKAWRLTKANPLVPLGMIAVVFSYRMAFLRSRERRQTEMNYWLRMRVATQGFTLFAMSWTLKIWPQIFPAFDKEHPGWLGPRPVLGIADDTEAQKLRFGERMREAEAAHAAETAYTATLIQKSGPAEGADANATVTATGAQSGYWRWLRWGSGSGSSAPGSNAAAADSVVPASSKPAAAAAAAEPRKSTSWLGGLTWSSGSDKDKDKKA
ncbi:hypothetical protein FIBSPDRAFT_850234 [Athelia psychrophila]|uniref:HIG1 domain-containing protein n=1 Tax=Athelia psychrophila TaxID=1759441 RepID=A0A166TMU4_9AGAM|nr:hypothetical protein FIBSPDRAFT_850234 [Fibularhizoctonia sp. CBS 109695]